MSKDVEFSKKSARPPVLSYTNSIPLIVDKLLAVAHKSNAIGASPLVLILRYLWNVVENSPLYKVIITNEMLCIGWAVMSLRRL